MMPEQKNDNVRVSDNLHTLIDLSRKTQGVNWIGGYPFALAPQDTKVHDLSRFAQKPPRKTANVRVDRVQSLAQYVMQYGGQDGSTIAFADVQSGRINVILDYHSTMPGEQRWCGHAVSFELTKTREWKHWLNGDGVWMKQADFAEWLEDRLGDIVDPPSADLHGLIKTLTAKKSVNFSSSVRLDNGDVGLTYEEDTKYQSKGKGQIEMPTMMTLGVRPFEGMDKWKLHARLRVRVGEGAAFFKFVLVEPDRVWEAAFEEQVEQLTELTKTKEQPGLTPIRGRVRGLPADDQ